MIVRTKVPVFFARNAITRIVEVRNLIRALVECVSKYGNLLLNVGPNAMGEIPEELLEILEAVGKWMKNNGESIYGCSSANLPKPEWGRNTQKGNFLYAHVYDRGTGPIDFQGLKGKIKKSKIAGRRV
ncbi:alpha-L-fucosidase [Fictibacillus gelatini]|uniref:alpha-L-fucosidase n=1 Tax=Fictibacillus gelatini TaxID=225985 RepID=UPI000401C9EE|nr:alpha-L-fucosidase [Fictibacillus gelatini]